MTYPGHTPNPWPWGKSVTKGVPQVLKKLALEPVQNASKLNTPLEPLEHQLMCVCSKGTLDKSKYIYIVTMKPGIINFYRQMIGSDKEKSAECIWVKISFVLS